MSRAIIGGVVAAVIVLLTAAAYFVTTSSLSEGIHDDVEVRVAKANRLLGQNNTLDFLGLQQRAARLADDPGFAEALGLKADTGDARKKRDALIAGAMARFTSGDDESSDHPDIIAVTDADGDIVAMLDVPKPVPGQWKEGGEIKYPAVEAALSDGMIIAEVWDYENQGLMKVGVAPIVGVVDVTDPEDPEKVVGKQEKIVGALVIAYAMTALDAQVQANLLGAHVAYFHGDKVFATSFRSRAGEEDTEMQGKLSGPLAESGIAAAAIEKGRTGVSSVELDGTTYLVAAGRMPRFASEPLDDWPPPQAGALVMMAPGDAMGPVGTARNAILLVGAGALLLAMVGMALTARRILGQADQIQVCVHDIINGNLDRTVPAVGSDLDGLANALNVMLARLLGRPEPGEEEYDEQGNIVSPGHVSFDEEISPADSQNMALAQEPEADYYKRTFEEYVAARAQVGETGDVSFDNFVAKLRLNEGKLKGQYEARAVRFRVVVKDGKVTLKPVPIM